MQTQTEPPVTDLIPVLVPKAALEALVKKWGEGCSNLDIVVSVRDLFDGQDGELLRANNALRIASEIGL